MCHPCSPKQSLQVAIINIHTLQKHSNTQRQSKPAAVQGDDTVLSGRQNLNTGPLARELGPCPLCIMKPRVWAGDLGKILEQSLILSLPEITSHYFTLVL
jgi:hypothetical protein